MPTEIAPPPYGTGRTPGVSYLEVEQAAITLLKEGVRPSVERVRAKLGRGSPQTLLSALKRFWRDLGLRVESDPAALTRLPAEIVGTVEALWQRALALAADAASQREGANLERLDFLKRENELKAHSLSLREKELDAHMREREKRIKELEGSLRTAMTFIAQQNVAIATLEQSRRARRKPARSAASRNAMRRQAS